MLIEAFKGTTRIGNSADNSVADAQSRVHGFPNLWVGGNGCLPDATGSNPTRTSVCFQNHVICRDPLSLYIPCRLRLLSKALDLSSNISNRKYESCLRVTSFQRPVILLSLHCPDRRHRPRRAYATCMQISCSLYSHLFERSVWTEQSLTFFYIYVFTIHLARQKKQKTLY